MPLASISELANPRDSKLSFTNQLLDVVMLYLSLLCSMLTLCVFSRYTYLVVPRKATSFMVSNKIQLTNLQIRTASLAACPGAIYRALMVDVDTVLCFLLLSSEVAIHVSDEAVLWWAPGRCPIWSTAVHKGTCDHGGQIQRRGWGVP